MFRSLQEVPKTSHWLEDSSIPCVFVFQKIKTRAQVEVKQRDHGTLRGEVSTITLHMEQKQEKERLARERVENLEVGRDACARPVCRSDA